MIGVLVLVVRLSGLIDSAFVGNKGRFIIFLIVYLFVYLFVFYLFYFLVGFCRGIF
jgi:hypothetical protein